MKAKKKKRTTKKKRLKKLAKSELNIEAITRNTENFILRSGIAPGMAEEIKMRRRMEPMKRFSRREAAYITR